MNTFFSHPTMRLLGGLSLAAVILALVSYTVLNFVQMQHLDMMPATISITGEGEVLAVPDIGQFTFSVRAEATEAAAAQEQSGTIINDILAFLEESGVAETDVTTTSYNLYPTYDWIEQICLPGEFCQRGEQVQVGFEVNQSVQVKVRNTDSASAILAGVGERKATNISGLNFVVDDTDTLMDEARTQAIADARTQAEKLAVDLGVTLGDITGYFEEDPRYAPAPFQVRSMAFDAMAEEGFGGAELPMGEERTVARVTIVYEIN